MSNSIVIFAMGVLTGMLILIYVFVMINLYKDKSKDKSTKGLPDKLTNIPMPQTPSPKVHTKEDFAKETGIDYFYDIKLNGIQGYCSNMCINHQNKIAEIKDSNLNIQPFECAYFDYRNGYYKGRGVVEMKGFDPNTNLYDYYIKIEKYNCT